MYRALFFFPSSFKEKWLMAGYFPCYYHYLLPGLLGNFVVEVDNHANFYDFLQKWLKPGGELLISDYCRGAKELSDTMKAYIAKRHYHLLTPVNYGKVKWITFGYTCKINVIWQCINSRLVKLYDIGTLQCKTGGSLHQPLGKGVSCNLSQEF